MAYAVAGLLLFEIVLLSAAYGLIRRKNMHLWLKHYLYRQWCIKPKRQAIDGPIHILFCFADHYEPQWGKPNSLEVERARVDRWHQQYPKLFGHIRDADGHLPKHSYFYPEEEYREEHLTKLSDLCQQGYGEIEIHLHHDNDTRENLTQTLTRFVDTLHRVHGALAVHPDTQQPGYAFIHGNWCLDNSRPDGRYCGVNDELLVLKQTGCYVDYTLPSAPSDTQTATVNSIYYATDDPDAPKSHDRGVPVQVGGQPCGDLMLIQGPLCLNWRDRKWGVMPKIESGDIRRSIPPSEHRVDLWVDCHVHVQGRPEWVFIKVHTHGTQEVDMDTLLGPETVKMYEYLASRYNDGQRYCCHFVSAREMYNIAKAAEAGETGNPHAYRDYLLPLPPMLDKAPKAERSSNTPINY